MKLLSAAVLVVAAALVPDFSLAGYKVSNEVHFANVTVNGQNRIRVTGTIMGAHNSADKVQWIYCRPHAEIGYCGARDASGAVRSCSTGDPLVINAMTGINAASHIRFDIVTGTCRSVEISHSSQNLQPFAGFSPQPSPGVLVVSP
jgi:hypothetical protein